MERTLSVDLTDGTHRARVFIDGGVFGPVGAMRLEETGTEMGDMSERIYSIHPNDPLSCRAQMDQETMFRRDDWDVRIKIRAEMHATATAFHLTASVTCWDGEEAFHHVDWAHEIPRNGM